jgi:hypothetical protein
MALMLRLYISRTLALGLGLMAGFACVFSVQAGEPQAQPSVQDNIREMDKDRDGIVTVYEVRAFMEARHGAGYEKDLMDSLVSSAQGKSCATPFAKSFY